MNKHLASIISAFAISCAGTQQHPNPTSQTIAHKQEAKEQERAGPKIDAIGTRTLRQGDYSKADGTAGNWFDDEKRRDEYYCDQFLDLVDDRRRKAAKQLREEESPAELRRNLKESFSRLSMQDKIDYLAGKKKLDERIELWLHDGLGDENESTRKLEQEIFEEPKNDQAHQYTGDFDAPEPLEGYVAWLDTLEDYYADDVLKKKSAHILLKTVKLAKSGKRERFGVFVGEEYVRSSSAHPIDERLTHFKDHPLKTRILYDVLRKGDVEVFTYKTEPVHRASRWHLRVTERGRPQELMLIIGEKGITSVRLDKDHEIYGSWDRPDYVTQLDALETVEKAHRLAREQKRDEFDRQFETLLERQPMTEPDNQPQLLRKENLDRIYELMRSEQKPLIENAFADRGLGAIVHFSSKKGVDLVVRDNKIVGAYEW